MIINSSCRAGNFFPFSPRFFEGIEIYKNQMQSIEDCKNSGEEVDDEGKKLYEANAVSIVINTTAGLESYINEFYITNYSKSKLLTPEQTNLILFFWNNLNSITAERMSLKDKFLKVNDIVNHPIHSQPDKKIIVDNGSVEYGAINKLVELRNMYIHQKQEPIYDYEDTTSLQKYFNNVGCTLNPFRSNNDKFPFPYGYLSLSIATWAIDNSKRFIRKFETNLEMN